MAKIRNLGGSGFRQDVGPINLDATATEITDFFDKAEKRLAEFQAALQSGMFGAMQRWGMDLQKQFDAANKRAAYMVRTIKDGRIAAMLGEAGDQLGKLREKLERFSPAARAAFVAGTASITGFVTAASPDTMQTFAKSVQLLSASIGQAFLPYVIKAAAWVQRLAAWFRQLSPEQKEQYAKWALIAVGIAGVIMILPKLIGGVQLAIQAVQGLSGAFQFLAAHPALAAVIAALALVGKFSLDAVQKWDKVVQDSTKAPTREELQDPVAQRLLAIKDHKEREKAAWAEVVAQRERFDRMDRIGNNRLTNFVAGGMDILSGLTMGLTPEDPRRAAIAEITRKSKVAHDIYLAAKQGKSVTAAQGKNAGDSDNLLLSLHSMQANYVGLADAHKQAQLQALTGSPLDQQILDIQRESRDRLVNMDRNIADIAGKPDPKPAVGR